LQSLRPYHQAEIDPIALRDYLCCAFVPGERTMWKGVKELSSGTVLTLPQVETNVFWRIVDKSKSEIEDMGYYADRLRNLLLQVVRENLPEHEKVGVFLSGGLDSSAVAALSAKIHQQEVIAYSIHFGKDLPNELEFSGLVAQHCGLEHQLLEIFFRDMWKFLPEAMALLDDPIGDPLTVPNLLLAKLAKQSVSIILNGEGGDPCFGGPKNQPMLLNQVYGGNLNTSYLRSFQKCADDLPQLLKPEIWELVKDKPFFFESDL
jgi:asparagine synthase (glutamine-hydrolysing)